MLCALALRKAIRHYVELVVEVFEENLEISFPGRGRYQMPIKDGQGG